MRFILVASDSSANTDVQCCPTPTAGPQAMRRLVRRPVLFAVGVQALAHFLARFEIRYTLAWYIDIFAGAWVAALARITRAG